MADRLDAVNASFEDCEEQDDDVEIMQTEETAPMIDMDVTGGSAGAECEGFTQRTFKTGLYHPMSSEA